MITNYARIDIKRPFILQAYTRLTLTARVIVHLQALSEWRLEKIVTVI